MLVTRSSQPVDLPQEFLRQLFARPAVLAVAAGFLVVLMLRELPAVPLLAWPPAAAAWLRAVPAASAGRGGSQRRQRSRRPASRPSRRNGGSRTTWRSIRWRWRSACGPDPPGGPAAGRRPAGANHRGAADGGGRTGAGAAQGPHSRQPAAGPHDYRIKLVRQPRGRRRRSHPDRLLASADRRRRRTGCPGERDGIPECRGTGGVDRARPAARGREPRLLDR